MNSSVEVLEAGPATLTRAYARQTLLELAGGRRHRYAFVDRDGWFIRYRQDIPAPSTVDEIVHLPLLWESFSSLEGAVLVYKGKRPAVDDIKGQLSAFAGLIDALTDERVVLMAEEIEKIYKAALPHTFNRDFVAHHLGVKANRRTFKKVWEQFLECLPGEESEQLSRGGRRRSLNQNPS